MEQRPFNDVAFESFLNEEKLMGSRCTSCGKLFVPPRPICIECSGTDMEWIEMKGDGKLSVTGDLGGILNRCLADADAMYYNDGGKVSRAYDYNERKALYNWWKSLKEMAKDLKKQKKFKEADVVAHVKKKAVETSYNYYGIEPQKITAKVGIVIFSLIFYVIYTMWYGFGFMYMFEGWGMKLDH